MHSYGNAANTVQKPNNTMTLDQKSSGSTPDGAAPKGLKMICFQTFFLFSPGRKPDELGISSMGHVVTFNYFFVYELMERRLQAEHAYSNSCSSNIYILLN